MGPEMDKLKAFSFGGGPGKEGNHVPLPPEPQKKAKPMSKRLSSNISQCSAKLAEVVSWEAKIQENKAGLKLLLMSSRIVFRFLLPELFPETITC